MLAQRGYEAVATGEVDAALRELMASSYDCVLCDRTLVPSVAGRARGVDDGPAIVSIGEHLDAYDWVAKPVHPQTLDQVFRRVEERQRLLRDNRDMSDKLEALPAPAAPDASLGGMVGESAAIKRLFREVRKVAQYKTNVLITGESGTGKELVAHAIHDLSPRCDGPFVAINCGAIPPALMESELFGHCKGAFTDAVRDKLGMFEEADGGTLFLDEIGELPLELQVKLLRVLQEEEVRPIGENQPTSVDVHVIAATVRDLEAAVAVGQFREDLFYRLNVLPLHLPALSERRDDIPLLVQHFIAEYSRKHGAAGMKVRGVSAEAMDRLMVYGWPGNIRELENTIERAMVLCEDDEISAALLEDKICAAPAPAGIPMDADELSIKKGTRSLERRLIERALTRTAGNRTNAAKLLEISHRALLYKIKEYGL